MPPPIRVELVPHSPNWARDAQNEVDRLCQALGANVIAIHHIGSTAVPGIRAKPIVDLVPIVRCLAAFDDAATLLGGLGYECWGEYGISGRRYCTLNDPGTGQRRFQLHCYETGHSEIKRHVAFRDYLRENPDKAREYDAEKHRCQQLHPNNSHSYSDAKAAWIIAHLAQALTYYESSCQYLTPGYSTSADKQLSS